MFFMKKMNESDENDCFKPVFKYYKSKAPPPKLDKVIDIQDTNVNLEKVCLVRSDLKNHPHLQDATNWSVFKLPIGIYLISNPFNAKGIDYWTLRCLKDFSLSKNNLKNEECWWDAVQTSSTKLIDKLRWATLGFHHDWDTKVYAEHGDFPSDLADLSATIIGQIDDLRSDSYKAEAAIINYYPMDATLSGHVDFSEPNKTAPLISMSFGQSAIFLIGGPTKSTEPQALYLRNGDVLIMSHQARQSFHAVPKILKNEGLNIDGSNQFVREYLQTHRINMNVRQVF